MTTYEIITTDLGSEIIKRTDESGAVAWIPLDPGNSDYQAFLDKDKPEAALSTPMVTEE